MYRSARALVLGASLLPSLALHAEEPPETIVVTATRTARTADETLAAVTVLTREDIERSQANDIAELLRGLAGVHMTSTGGYGKTSSMFLRGTNPGHVLLLVDGVRIGSATAGQPSWEFLPLAEIERIEIVRGPRSSLYGSEAIGGVVQIFTRRGGGPLQPSARVMGGSFHTYDANAGVTGGGDRAWFNVHAGQFATHGINATRPENTVFDPDSDGFDNRYGSARVGYRLGQQTDIEIFALHAKGNTEFDSFPGAANETDFLQDSGAVRLQSRLTSVWNTTLQIGGNRDHNFTFLSGNPSTSSQFNTNRRSQSWQNDFALTEHQLLTLGLDRQEDRVSTSANLVKNSRDNKAGFALYQGDFGAHSLQASWRRDDNEQFGTHDTGSAAYGYTLTPRYRLYASYGTGFRAPSFIDLYWPDPVFSTGNPNLQPEESKSAELGLIGRTGNVQWITSAFRTRIDNLIVLTGPTFLPVNLNRAVINGLELSGATPLAGWNVGATATLLDARDQASDRYLQRVPRYATRFDVNRTRGHTLIGAAIVAESARYSDVANQQRLGGFTVVDVHLEQRLVPDWRLRARIENLFDKDYQTVAGYNNIGRAVFVSLSYQRGTK
ncbi:MAG: TonB-dependent receptor domain-containing protein [Sulfurifustaceae bacterium]